MGLVKQKQGDRSLRSFAKDIGVSVAYLSDLNCGHRDPGPTILDIFGIRKIKTSTVTYVQGALDQESKRADRR